MPQFFWPTPALRARAVTSANAASGIALPLWPGTGAYTFDGSKFEIVPMPAGIGSTTFSGIPYLGTDGTTHDYILTESGSNILADFNSAANTLGFSAGIITAAGANYFLLYENYLIGYTTLIASNGSLVYQFGPTIPTALNETFLGLAAIGSNVYWSAASGRVFTYTTSAVEVFQNFGHQTRAIATDGTKLYGALPGNGLGVLTFSAQATATASVVTAPMTNPYLLAGCASGVAVGGSSYAQVASGSTAFAASPTTPATIAAATLPALNSVALFTGIDPNLTVTFVASGITNPEALAWTNNGEQLLISQTSANAVAVYDLVGSTLVSQQSLSVVDAAALAVTPVSDQALVCQPTQNTLAILNNSVNVWSTGGTVSVTAPACVLITSNTSAVCGDSTSLAYLARSGNSWSVASTLALGFTPLDIAQDTTGVIYVTGTSAASGFLSSIASGAVMHQASWSGSGVSVYVEQGQIAVADGVNSTVRWFDSTLTSQGSHASVPGLNGIYASADSIWLTGTSAIWQMTLTAPYTFSRNTYGTVATYLGASWKSYSIPQGDSLAALTFAGSLLYAATQKNELYAFPTTGTFVPSGQVNIPVYTGQTSGETMGISSLLWTGTHLYAATYASGVLVEIQ
jgi:hypothetical protein